jgi:hypothetical protein
MTSSVLDWPLRKIVTLHCPFIVVLTHTLKVTNVHQLSHKREHSVTVNVPPSSFGYLIGKTGLFYVVDVVVVFCFCFCCCYGPHGLHFHFTAISSSHSQCF